MRTMYAFQPTCKVVLLCTLLVWTGDFRLRTYGVAPMKYLAQLLFKRVTQ